MPLKSGTTFGPYVILSALGAGGMGEVYKAKDSRLDRTVAIKVLIPELSSDEDLVRRFLREGKSIAALNHPHICSLHDVGVQDGVNYIVMEYIEGETFAPPLPPEKAVVYGIQICHALEAAHRQGIVHRDLKPANLLITKSGVKILDFGLAKQSPLKDFASTTTNARPTLTGNNVIAGTLSYMAPEQLQGHAVDHRADIFSFGLVFYEMLTGKQAFPGASAASIIAAIVQSPSPKASAAPSRPPAALDYVIETCLEKDPDERWQSARDLRRELQRCELGVVAARVESARISARRTAKYVNFVTGLLVLLGLYLGAQAFLRSKTDSTPPIQAFVGAPDKTTLNGQEAISRDGRLLALVASAEGKRRIYVRPLNSFEAKPVEGTEYGSYPFWSPDGKSIGFISNGKLKIVEVATGAVQVIADARDGRGGAWSPQGVIVYASGPGVPLHRVSLADKKSISIGELDVKNGENAHSGPWFLPDGKRFLYYVRADDPAKSAIMAGSLEGGVPTKILASSGSGAYVPPFDSVRDGHLIYLDKSRLYARPFDAGSLKFTGDARVVADHVGTSYTIPLFSVSATGVLVWYEPTGWSRQLTWRGPKGEELASFGEPADYMELSVIPRTDRILMRRTDQATGTASVWLVDAKRGLNERLTVSGSEVTPVPSPDGSQIAYCAMGEGIFRRPVNGGGQPERLTTSHAAQVLSSWSADGRFLLYSQLQNDSYNIFALPLFGDRKPVPVVANAFNSTEARFSPDGKWMAYISDSTGRPELYVQSFPEGAGKIRLSLAGASSPRWSRDGKELYYISTNNKMMAVRLQAAGGGLEAMEPKALFSVAPEAFSVRGYFDLASNGGGFLQLSPVGSSQGAGLLRISTGWLAPANP